MLDCSPNRRLFNPKPTSQAELLRLVPVRLLLQANTLSESVSSLSGATRSCFSAMFLMR